MMKASVRDSLFVSLRTTTIRGTITSLHPALPNGRTKDLAERLSSCYSVNSESIYGEAENHEEEFVENQKESVAENRISASRK
jgi:hypothetical protein